MYFLFESFFPLLRKKLIARIFALERSLQDSRSKCIPLLEKCFLERIFTGIIIAYESRNKFLPNDFY